MAGGSDNRVNLDDLRIREESSRGRGRGILLLLLLLLIPAAFAAGWYFGPGSAGAGFGGAIPVRTAIVSAGGARKTSGGDGFSEGGWIEVPSYHPIHVTALTSGRVEELSVLEGSKVAKGQVVARLYDRDLRDSLRAAEAVLSERKAELALLEAGYRAEDVAKQQAEVNRLREEAAFAAKVLARTTKLVPTGAASREDLERDTSAVATAKSRLRAAEEELGRLNAGFRKEEIDKARASLAKAAAARDLASANLSYVEVRSPADGVVLERYVTVGTWLSATNPRVVSLYDPTDLQVRVDIRQENAGTLNIGQEAEVSVEAVPGKTWRGRVIRVEPKADFKKNTLQAKIRLEETDPVLHPEMICRVRFVAGESKAPAADTPKVLTVPESSVRKEAGKTFVFVVNGGQVRRTEIRAGDSANGRVVVAAGLVGGERVVLSPEGLSDGDEVTEASR